MKITKAKLKQIISEELSSMSEYGGIYEDEPEMAEKPEPVAVALAKVEELGTLVMNGDPGGEGALAIIEELITILKGIMTGPSNQVAQVHAQAMEQK
jgi:hypothetical protein